MSPEYTAPEELVDMSEGEDSFDDLDGSDDFAEDED